MKRKDFLLALGAGLIPLTVFPGKMVNSIMELTSGDPRLNFHHIYSDPTLRTEFFNFLRNVFNLYPEEDLHQLITDTAGRMQKDKDIYLEVQSRLSEVTPFMSIFNYQLPALRRQKEVMASQSVELLGSDSRINGYLEIGSSGRYLDYLEERIRITGERYYADGKKPGYSLSEMVDRGQVRIGATYIPFTDYYTRYGCEIPQKSLDLVTNYIGFHHCPVELRTGFISSIRDTLRYGGKLILRDHDCDSRDQHIMVALAHDVFNMGTRETWEYNEREVRHFYSLEFIRNFVEDLGFRYEGCSLFQPGDPTRNALMLFTKV